jgi:hypothetical protein
MMKYVRHLLTDKSIPRTELLPHPMGYLAALKLKDPHPMRILPGKAPRVRRTEFTREPVVS